MNKIRIITDSASDMVMPKRDDVTILPLTITFSGKQYLDGVTIKHKEFYEKLIENDELPTTSLISPGVFEEVYENAIKNGEQIIVITLSSKLSGTYQSAVLAADAFDEKITVIDSLNATIGEQILVQYALKLIDEGMSYDEITSEIEKEKNNIHILGLLDTLEYLKKGGRISKTVAFVGGALAIKPVVTVEDGEVKMLGKARGSKNGNNYLIKEIEKTNGIDFNKPFCLGYTGLDDSMLQKYIEDSSSIWKGCVNELPICTVGATIGTHVGPNAIVVAFFGK